MAKPNVNMVGRTAGSPDNAQGTHFFLINDTGTYFLRKLPPSQMPRSAKTLMRGPKRQGEVSRLPHRRAGGQARFPRLSRFEPLPVEPAGDYYPISGCRPVPPIYQWHDVSPHPARGRETHHRRRPQFLSPGRRQEMGEEWFLKQGYQNSARAIARCARRSKPT